MNQTLAFSRIVPSADVLASGLRKAFVSTQRVRSAETMVLRELNRASDPDLGEKDFNHEWDLLWLK